LDGTFFKDRYKDKLLATIAYDSDNGLFPLAFCVCDIENEDNWNWFISGLRKMLYKVPKPYTPPHQLEFMSDANKGLGSTIERYFPDSLCSLCVLHLMENYKNS